MRVLHIYKASLPESMGGVEQVINTLAIGCVKKGLVVDVLALSSNKTYKTDWNGCSIY